MTAADPQSPPRTADDLALALRLADAADVITTGRFGATDLVVEAKPDLTPVSDADRAVEQTIRARLAEHRPDDAMSGEEFGADGTAARRWVIDPIDGTKNFVRGVPVWATLDRAARRRRRRGRRGVGPRARTAVVGGARTVAHGRARSDRRRAGWRCRGSPRSSDASLSYASLAGWAERGQLDAFVALTQQVWRSRAYGDFWSYMLVAEGAVDVAAEPELSLWDMAALAPIVTEAGGRFTGLDGVPGVHQGNAGGQQRRCCTSELLAAPSVISRRST